MTKESLEDLRSEIERASDSDLGNATWWPSGERATKQVLLDLIEMAKEGLRVPDLEAAYDALEDRAAEYAGQVPGIEDD
jgi:hypothetical protein